MNILKLTLATAMLALFAITAQAQTMGPNARDYGYGLYNGYGPYNTYRDPTTREALDTGTW